MAKPRLSRYRRRRDPSAVVVGLAGTLLLVPPVIAQAPPAIDLSSITHLASSDTIPDQDLFLEVVVGERPVGSLTAIQVRDGAFWIEASALHSFGFELPAELPVNGGGWLRLDDVPGLSMRYDVAEQRLYLLAPPSLRSVQYIGNAREGPEPQARRDPGALFTYRAYGDRFGDHGGLSAFGELRIFGGFGAFEFSGLARTPSASAAFRRMDTRWTYSDPGRLWTWTAGDFISGGLPWTRPVRMGGLQWRRNFGVRPDLVTMPVPRFRGEAAVPSSVELYVDNVRRYRAEVQEGPFVVDAIPRVTGAGIAQMVVTDALGRVTQTQFPIYSDRQLLATGLTDFSVEVGALRRGFSAPGDAYLGEVAFSSSVRHGASRTVTFEGHAEASDGLYVVGLGAVFSPWPRAGLFSGSYSRSAGRASGDRFSLGYQLVSGGWGLDLQTRRHTSGFRQLADLVPASDSVIDTTRRLFDATHLQTIRDLDQATLWLPVPRGSLALSWLNWRSHGGDRHGTGTVSLTQMLGPVSISASVFGDDIGVGGGLNLSVPLGPQRYASSSLNHRGNRTTTSLSVRQSRPYEGGWGWALQAGTQADPYAQVEASVRGMRGRGASVSATFRE